MWKRFKVESKFNDQCAAVNIAKHPAIKEDQHLIFLYRPLIMPPADTPQSTFHAPEGFEIPPGFVIGTIGDDNQPFLVPYYMVPTLERVISVKRRPKRARDCESNSQGKSPSLLRRIEVYLGLLAGITAANKTCGCRRRGSQSAPQPSESTGIQ